MYLRICEQRDRLFASFLITDDFWKIENWNERYNNGIGIQMNCFID